MAQPIDNTDDQIDSRDVIARIEELSAEREPDDAPLTEEEMAELAALVKLAADGDGIDDWDHGAQLIRDSYFETHARELAEETCTIGTGWPHYCIDWEYAARELQHDYSSVTFDGITYWVR